MTRRPGSASTDQVAPDLATSAEDDFEERRRRESQREMDEMTARIAEARAAKKAAQAAKTQADMDDLAAKIAAAKAEKAAKAGGQ